MMAYLLIRLKVFRKLYRYKNALLFVNGKLIRYEINAVLFI